MKIQNWLLIVDNKVHMKHYQGDVQISEQPDGLGLKLENIQYMMVPQDSIFFFLAWKKR
jgi:hypothetical protein